MSHKEYRERAVRWWQKNRWTVIHAVDRSGITAMCIALPVTEAYFNRARSGVCMSYACEPADVEPDTSPFITVEALGPNPALRRSGGHVGLSLVMAMICQQARLSDVPGLGSREVPLRALSFAGTPLNGKRLKRFGYKPLGTFMPGTEVEYFERRLAFRGGGFWDAAYMGIWRGLQPQLRELDQPRTGADGLPGPAGLETA